MKRRPILGIVAVIAVLVAIVVLSRPRQDPYERPALDPRGTGPQGLAATAQLLRTLDARVRLGGLPSDGDDVVLQPRDTLGGEPARRMRDWVRGGGTLVVADPTAALAARTVDTYPGRATTTGTCDVDALTSIRALGVSLPRLLVPEDGDSRCASATVGPRRSWCTASVPGSSSPSPACSRSSTRPWAGATMRSSRPPSSRPRPAPGCG